MAVIKRIEALNEKAPLGLVATQGKQALQERLSLHYEVSILRRQRSPLNVSNRALFDASLTQDTPDDSDGLHLLGLTLYSQGKLLCDVPEKLNESKGEY